VATFTRVQLPGLTLASERCLAIEEGRPHLGHPADRLLCKEAVEIGLKFRLRLHAKEVERSPIGFQYVYAIEDLTEFLGVSIEVRAEIVDVRSQFFDVGHRLREVLLPEDQLVALEQRMITVPASFQFPRSVSGCRDLVEPNDPPLRPIFRIIDVGARQLEDALGSIDSDGAGGSAESATGNIVSKSGDGGEKVSNGQPGPLVADTGECSRSLIAVNDRVRCIEDDDRIVRRFEKGVQRRRVRYHWGNSSNEITY
jgi:hypothetical protein